MPRPPLSRKLLQLISWPKLQAFVEDVKAGKIEPFKEKTERARKDLKKAGLIK